jgi:hypothetical protein
VISAYLDSETEMCRWLEEVQATQFVPLAATDYYADLDGVAKAGRTVVSAPYDVRKLGQLVKQVQYPLKEDCAFGSTQIDAMKQAHWTKSFASWKSFSHVYTSLLRYVFEYVQYGKGTNLCNGNAPVGHLLEFAVSSRVTL